MPIQPTYPGVYVQELPSGVHPITGVSTSVTAFMGLAKRGPINKPTHIFSFADYTQKFGGLDANSQMSYAVSQFFLNGGSEAWILRLALNAKKAFRDLPDKNRNPSITVTAVDEGKEGDNIQVIVDDNTTDKTIGQERFNLTISYISQDNAADNRTEVYKGLSIDKTDSRFVESVINQVSLLVTAKANSANLPMHTSMTAGMLTSGTFSQGDFTNLLDSTHNSIMIAYDGSAANQVTLDTTNLPDPTKALTELMRDLATRIQKAVQSQLAGIAGARSSTCTVSSDNTKLILTSGTVGSTSSVTVTDAAQKNVADKLHLDTGGTNPATSQAGTSPLLQKGGGDPFDINNNPGLFFPTSGNMLDKIDLFNLMCLPGVTDAGTLNLALAYCKPRRAFLIIDAPHPNPDGTPPGFTPDQMYNYITSPSLPKGDDGTYAAIYYPWVQSPDPLNNGKLTSFPPCGLIAGLYAATDSSRGVWKAPAGTSANLLNVQGLDYLLTNGQNGMLNQVGVNCLRIFPIYGAVSWGSRTVSGADGIGSEYKYVPVRRTALFIEESLYRGLQWVVFEPNDEPLWAQIRLNVGAFMHDLFRKGAFQGQTPKDAYFVKCDSETTTQTDINHGIVNIIVGFAPLKPAEFVILSIQQIAGQIQV
jgi:phage tail sheath protein FI